MEPTKELEALSNDLKEFIHNNKYYVFLYYDGVRDALGYNRKGTGENVWFTYNWLKQNQPILKNSTFNKKFDEVLNDIVDK